MEPTQETEPQGNELPRPVSIDAAAEGNGSFVPEAAYAETSPGQQPAQQIQPVQVQPPAVPSVSPLGLSQQVNDSQATANSDDNIMIADDADLIEKEWVTRAKAIVEQTKEDPFEQNKAINKVKAEYIKKRYNKDLKVSEG
jgi:hypothetical protein